MRVTVFGVGYVGLVQAAMFAEAGHDVLCIDTDEKKVERLKGGGVPIYEPGLEPIVRQAQAEGRLQFSIDAAQGVAFADVQMIAVGTPADEDGSADLRHVLSVARSIGEHMDDTRIVVIKSTVPVGSGDKVEAEIRQRLTARRLGRVAFSVVSNPEFLKEGSAIADCAKPDRIIVGTDDPQAEDVLRELYAPFNRNHEKLIVMDRKSAELTKYAANAMLATRISFMNEIASISARLGADIEAVRKGIGSDPRIGYDFIYAGIGYGGSCFPKDVSALTRMAEEVDCAPTVLHAVQERNAAQKGILFEMLRQHFGDLRDCRFALWGLAFKANTDDMREASSRVLMEALWEAGATVQAYDPVAMEACQMIYGTREDLVLCGTKEAALRGADALLIATEWKSFRVPSFEAIREALGQNVIFDGRNLYDPATVVAHGLNYYSIGRRPLLASAAGARQAACNQTAAA